MSSSMSRRNLSAFAFSDSEMELKFNFVLEATGVSNLMRDAIEVAKTMFPEANEDIELVSYEECLNIKKADLKDGTRVFIFDEFDVRNEAFMYVKSADSAIILGTRCLMTVLQEEEPVPDGIKYIHNLSMKNLLVCTSGMKKEQRARIRELVSYMGGIYGDTLQDNSTHLVTETVKSDKYLTASNNKIRVMHSNWINDVWKEQQQSVKRIVATDERFDRHKLPMFFNLCFTTTGIESALRTHIKSLVEEHGGNFSGSFNSRVDILLMEQEAINSEKCKAAMKLKKFCLNPKWIEDSIESGYSIDMKEYTYEDNRKLKASTPTKDEAPSRFLPDCSQVSDVNITRASVCLSETRSDPPEEGYKRVLKRLSLPAVKKVGNVLDDFSVYLSGFNDTELVYLGKVLSVLGATRIVSICSQISHIFVGAENPKLFAELDKADIEPTILKLEWLVKVVEAKESVDQEAYTIARPVSKRALRENPSPASKKAIMSLNGTFKKPPIPKFTMNTERQEEIDEEMAMVNQYIEPAPPSLQGNFSEDTFVEFLTGMNVFIHGFSDLYQSASVIANCEKYGATLVDGTFRNIVDYVITSSALLPKLELKVKFKHLVTDKWLEDALEAESCVEVSKFHKPIVMVPSKPLKNEIFVVSNYKGSLRTFVEVLVKSMGGNYKEVFKRAESPILISPNNEGAKFKSAQSYGLTVLNIEWLFECHEKKRRADETPFLVGGTNASERNVLSRDSIVPSSQFDECDPPIENFADDVLNTTPISAVPRRLQTAVTPTTPVLNLSPSRLLVGMSEPRRTITHNALLEKRKILSPRRNQNSEDGEPRPTTSSRSRNPAISYALRPDASPDSQAFHKRKLEALDQNYVSRSTHKKKRLDAKVETPTPPAAVRRYDFFKARIADYDSPDPRAAANFVGGPSRITNEVAKNLRFSDCGGVAGEDGVEDPAEESVNEILPEFKHLKMPTAFMKKPSRLNLVIDEADNRKAESMPPLESENLVEWVDPSQQFSQNVEPSSSEVIFVPPKEYIFAFSLVEEADRKKFTKIINDLGGRIDGTNYTHLLTREPNRSEKLLIAMASGRFVLHFSYINGCSTAKKMIREDEYEFGNPKFSRELTGEDPRNDKQTRAPFRWRQWINTDYKKRFKDGAFTDQTFIIAASSDKMISFRNVLIAGGGKVVEMDLKSTLSENVLKRTKVNTCLYDKQNAPSKVNIQILKSCKIALENVTFINQYLFSDDLP